MHHQKLKSGESEAKEFDVRMATMNEEKMALEEELKEKTAKEENMAKELRRVEEERESFDQIKAELKKVIRSRSSLQSFYGAHETH